MAKKEIQDLENEIVEEELTTEAADSETDAAATLHPAAAPGESKAEMMQTFMQLLAQLGKEDLSDIFNQVQAQFGAGNAPGAVDNSDANRASVAMKTAPAATYKEDVEEMLAGDDLSEEFRDKAQTIFEAAVGARITLEEARLQEEYEAAVEKLEEEFAENLEETTALVFENITEKLDQYLDYAIAEWMTENEIAIDNSLRTDIAENFIDSLRNVFAEHYIEVPESRIDLVAEMKNDIDELKAKLDETLDENVQLKSVVIEGFKDSVIEEASSDLASTDAERLRVLAESVDVTDPDEYRAKVDMIKENYFGDRRSARRRSTGLITEEIAGEEEGAYEATVPADMQTYVKTISKIAK